MMRVTARFRVRLIAFASSLDRIGPFARTFVMPPTVMSTLAGRISGLHILATPVPDYLPRWAVRLPVLRIGIPTTTSPKDLTPKFGERLSGIALLEKLGCRRVSIRMPNTDYAGRRITSSPPRRPVPISPL